MRPVALGMSTHIGWAAVVALAGPPGDVEVVARRRIVMATDFETGAVYHAGQALPLDRAEALVQASAERFEGLAREALSALGTELRDAGLEPLRCALIWGSGRALPPLACILASHPLVHAAEAALYREVLERASEACRIPALRVPAKGLPARSAAALGLSPTRLQSRLAALGKAAGRPWARDQKDAALAAWIALAERSPGARGRESADGRSR